METNQNIPDFLETYVPQGDAKENLKFETESDFDPNDLGGAAGDDAGGGWGASGGDAENEGDVPADTNGWGSGDAGTTEAGGGWGSSAPTDGGWS